MKLNELAAGLKASSATEDNNNLLQKKVKSLEVVLKCAQSMNCELLNLPKLLLHALKSTLLITESKRSYIIIKTGPNKFLLSRGMDDGGKELAKEIFNGSKSIVEGVFSAGLPVYIQGVASSPLKSVSMINLDIKTIFCCPLLVQDKKIGVLYADSNKLISSNFNQTVEVFEILASHTSIAILNSLNMKKAEKAKYFIQK